VSPARTSGTYLHLCHISYEACRGFVVRSEKWAVWMGEYN